MKDDDVVEEAIAALAGSNIIRGRIVGDIFITDMSTEMSQYDVTYKNMSIPRYGMGRTTIKGEFNPHGEFDIYQTHQAGKRFVIVELE